MFFMSTKNIEGLCRDFKTKSNEKKKKKYQTQ